MLRNLVDEIVRRRLWPIPLAALVVVVAAPLLFLKSAPPQAATDAIAATPAAQTDLPTRAQRLLTATDAGRTPERRLSRSERDPFQAPASRAAAAKKASKKASSSSKKTAATPTRKGTSDDPVAVVVQNADGSATSAATSGTSTSRSTSTSTSRSSDSTVAPSVDVRFGAHKDSPIERRIRRLKTFEVHGEIAVIFIKYSPTRHKAIFSIAPTTTVGGDVDCRAVDGVCSYVDIPVGSYARLTFSLSDGSRVSRRLDVVRSHDA